jgi:hypothetical protein
VQAFEHLIERYLVSPAPETLIHRGPRAEFLSVDGG